MKRWPELLAVVALVVVLAGAVLMQQREERVVEVEMSPAAGDADAGSSFAIRGARVFDGARGLGVANVVVRDGRIVAVGSDAAIPAALPVVDGRGKTLLPGLIDAHVHAWGNARRDALRFGVTTAVDMHGDAARLPQLRRERVSLARTDEADLWAAGTAVTVSGGHGTQYGLKVPTISAHTDIAAFIAERVAEGADFIKLIVEDGSAFGGEARIPTLTPVQVAAVIAAAHASERKAMVHVSTVRDAHMALEAGADGLAHVFVDAPADDAFVELARSRRAVVIPTLSVIASESGSDDAKTLAADTRIAPWLSPDQRAALGSRLSVPQRASYLRNAIANVGRLHAAGVPILAGTDAGNPGTAHGASLHGELVLLVRAGLTPAQALAAATSTPAARFGMADRGRIAPGLRADLALVEGDPIRDITATRAISRIWKNGFAVDRGVAASSTAAPEAVALESDETLVSDFDGDAIDARFGSGWQATTDAMAGGTSVAEFALVPGGAGGSRGALKVSGEIGPGFAYPWAGVAFSPAPQPMQPADVSARSTLVFHARGDGRNYTAMLITGDSMQGMPAMQTFTAGPDWREVRLPLSAFAGADLKRVRAIAFTAGQPAGRFTFRIDRVELQ